MPKLLVIFANVRGYKQAFPELCRVALDEKPAAICLVETHLVSLESIELPPEYVIAARKDRSRFGGGVLIMCQSQISHSEVDVNDLYKKGTSEIVAVKLLGTCLTCCYRQPNDDTTLVNNLNLLIDRIKGPAIIVGDLNAHEKEWLKSSNTNKAGEEIRDLCESKGLLQLVLEPTRLESTLDLVITNGSGKTKIIPSLGSSDHKTIVAEIDNAEAVPEIPAKRDVYHWAKADWGRLNAAIKRHNIDFNCNIDDAVSKVTIFLQELQKQYVPKSRPTMVRPTPFWNRSCQRAYEKKKEAEAIGNQSDILLAKTKAWAAYEKAKRLHQKRCKEMLEKGSNLKMFWKLTKHVASQSSVKSKATPKPDVLAKHFKEKFVLPEDSKTAMLDVDTVLCPVILQNFRCDRKDIIKILKNLDETKSVGHDGIGNRLLKGAAGSISSILVSLFKKILKSGSFPTSWKLGRVTALHKRGNFEDPENFRPVQVLCNMNMVLERVLSNQIRKVIHPTIPQSQFGYMPKAGAADMALLLSLEAAAALEERKEMRVVACDVRGAFDRCWIRQLLSDLFSIGFRGKAYALLESYLTNRTFIVVAKGEESEVMPAENGTPQGSCWSPDFYNVFTRKLNTVPQNCCCVTMADVTTLYQTFKKDQRDEAAVFMTKDLERLYDWGTRDS
jgi:hypothetical protein